MGQSVVVECVTVETVWDQWQSKMMCARECLSSGIWNRKNASLYLMYVGHDSCS